jgi:glucose-1-phosphate thymidylyltransferase
VIAIILAGGYGKRLWPITRDVAKPLLPVAGRPVIDYLLEKFLALKGGLNKFKFKFIVLTNSRFKGQFEDWAKKWQLLKLNIEVVSDGSSNEYEKPGAVGALAKIMHLINEDFLVVAGDCLYEDDLAGFIEFFKSKGLAAVGVYRAEYISQIKRGSSVLLDRENRIIAFVEKPEAPLSEFVGAVVYAFPVGIKDRIREYMELGLPRDEPGRLIEWLHRVEQVYGYLLKGSVWDIGTPESYREAERYVES